MIVFTHIPKTAGTSFKSLLRANYGARCVESNKVKRSIYTEQDLAFAKKLFFRIDALVGHSLKNPFDHLHEEEMTLVTFLRQPVDRCISHYQDRVLRTRLNISFEEWIKLEENQNLMVRFIAGSHDLQRAEEILKTRYHFVGFTERFEESLRMLNMLLEKPLLLSYRTSIKATSRSIQEKIMQDEKSMELARKCNALDQQLYDYALSEIYMPMLTRMAPAFQKAPVRSDRFTWRQWLNFHASIRYNKMIYRPLIKILHK